MASFRPRREEYGASFLDDILEELEARDQGAQIEWPVVEFGHYVDQLAVYFDQFPAEQVLVVDSAKLRADPRSELRRVEELVGLAHHEWQAEDLGPKFVGGYSEPPTPEARRFLAAYYHPFNDRLQAMLGREFDWA